MNNVKLISVHIHKTAGSTFHQILSRQAKLEEVVFANLEGVDNCLQRLKNMPENELNKIKIIHGHFPFGWHLQLKKEYKYITFVRDPVNRLISDYSYNKNNPNGHHHLYAKDKTLREYLLSPEVKLNDNGITRFIAGDFETEHGSIDEITFEKAKENLKRYFIFVGVTERFDESLLLLKNKLGFRKAFYKKENITSKMVGKLTDEEKQLIHRLTLYDRKIYEWVVQHFDLQMKTIRFKKAKSILLQIQNHLYSVYLRIRYNNLK